MTIAVELACAGGPNGDTVSPEAIHQAIYANATKGLPGGLGRHLHRRRSLRRRRRRSDEKGGQKPSVLGTFSTIHSRPPKAELRREVGHFEGDLIIGARNKSAILTLVDRASRFNLIGDLPGGHDAENVLACAVELLDRVPEELRCTLTWDKKPKWLDTTNLPRSSTLTSTSPTNTARGNAPSTRISMVCFDATSEKAPICPSTHPRISKPSVTASTRCHKGSSSGSQLQIATMLPSWL